MAALDDLRSGAIVQGIVPSQSVEIVSVDWIGEQAVNLVYRVPGGSVAETTLYRDDEHRLSVETRGHAWSFDADGALLFLSDQPMRYSTRQAASIGQSLVLLAILPLISKTSLSTECHRIK